MPTAATLLMAGLVATTCLPATGQEVPVVIVRPPEDVQPAPQPTAATVPSPAAPDGPALAVGPGAPAGPSGTTPVVAVRPPRAEGRPIPSEGGGTRPIVISPAIVPANRPDDEGTRPNPMLPTGSARSGPGAEDTAGGPTGPRPSIVPDRGRSGLLGTLFGRRSGPPQGGGEAATSATATGIDPGDPEQVAALRRGLERQIVGSEGGRLASLEVLVVGSRVHIRAQAARPWQRRALRRALEGLAMPSGFLATVEVR